MPTPRTTYRSKAPTVTLYSRVGKEAYRKIQTAKNGKPVPVANAAYHLAIASRTAAAHGSPAART